MYQMTGTLNMVDMAERLQDVNDTRTIRVAVAFVVVGISTKLAVFPAASMAPLTRIAKRRPLVSAFLAATRDQGRLLPSYLDLASGFSALRSFSTV